MGVSTGSIRREFWQLRRYAILASLTTCPTRSVTPMPHHCHQGIRFNGFELRIQYFRCPGEVREQNWLLFDPLVNARGRSQCPVCHEIVLIGRTTEGWVWKPEAERGFTTTEPARRWLWSE